MDTEILIGVCAIAGNASWALTGFGSAIIMQCLFHLATVAGLDGVSEMQTAVPLIMVMSTAVSWVQTARLRHCINWGVVVWILLPQTLAMPVGFEILYHIHSDKLKNALGGLFLLVAIYKFHQIWTSAPAATHLSKEGNEEQRHDMVHEKLDTHRWRIRAQMLASGTASGLTGGMFGTRGPPLMIFVVHSHIEPHEWRASTAAMSAISAPVWAAYLFLFKTSVPENWPLQFSILISCGLLGLWIGSVAARHVPKLTIQKMVLFVLSLASMLLMAAGHDEAVTGIVVGYFAVCVVGFMVACWQRHAKLRRRERSANSDDTCTTSNGVEFVDMETTLAAV